MADKVKKPALVELRPDRKLIDSKFESYKLSLNPLPSYKAAIPDGVYQVNAGDEEFSYEKIKCFTLHNYLILDPWNKENVYFVDSTFCLRRFHIPLETHIEPSKVVFSFGSEIAVDTDRLPPSVYFPSPTLCVSCDGFGAMYVLETGCRASWTTDVWRIVYFDEVKKSPSLIINSAARSDGADDVKRDFLECLFIKFEEISSPEPEKGAETVTEVLLEWITLEKSTNDEDYQLSASKLFRGKNVPNYCALAKDSTELHIASSSPFKYSPGWNSEADPEINDIVQSGVDENDKNTKPPAPYKWKQTKEDVLVFIDLPPAANKQSVVYSLSSRKIKVGIRPDKDAEPNILLDGCLCHDAVPEESNWSIIDGRLEVTIQKSVEGHTWFSVVEDDDRGELELDSEEVARVHKQLEHLTSETLSTENPGEGVFRPGELEECDSYYDSSASFAKFDSVSETFTHHADVSSLRWLFNCVLDANEPLGVVFRHDVDAFVWQPQVTSDGTNRRLWKHRATFNALGYVHASKTNLKFCACAPDVSYVALCECQRRIFIYRQPSPLTTSLRNRSSGQVIGKVAVQQVATLDSNDNILGFVASNERMYVLTSSELVVFKISVDAGA
ncbi:nudC domain-containing protein 1-like [Clavelina lepadiformis]|uniref:nudC domain-containing protein 1-like n=1 Tax=Clavelina lepadiformis TaxID=159417 RepID=UPI0040420D16